MKRTEFRQKYHLTVEDMRSLGSRYTNMLNRCYDIRNKKYKFYGGKGVCVCDSWRASRESFYEWSVASGFNRNLQIDRIDSSGSYCPENCRWVTRDDNLKNRSFTDAYAEASRRNLGFVDVKFRSSRVLEACSKPVRCVETGVVFPSQIEAARAIGLSNSAVALVIKGYNKTAGGFHWERV